MNKTQSNGFSIFLTIDAHSIFKYYNPHDLAPLYNRQLSHEFVEYLQNSIAAAKPNSHISFKLICKKEPDERFVNPLLKSIRRHFEKKRSIKEYEFSKFKWTNCVLLASSLVLIFLLQAALPFFVPHQNVFSNGFAFISWVILWKPIERLVFIQSSFKKDILLLKKMETAESTVILNEKEFVIDLKYIDAA